MNEQATEPTHVVTCFLIRRSLQGADEILLVQRSQRVRTYRGYWAAISGYLEAGATPIGQSRVELSEELGLNEVDATLLQTGEPLTFTDADIGVTWTVHPFLFRLRDGAALRTDWEATVSRWIAPVEMKSMQTVPMLCEAFERVYRVGSSE